MNQIIFLNLKSWILLIVKARLAYKTRPPCLRIYNLHLLYLFLFYFTTVKVYPTDLTKKVLCCHLRVFMLWTKPGLSYKMQYPLLQSINAYVNLNGHRIFQPEIFQPQKSNPDYFSPQNLKTLNFSTLNSGVEALYLHFKWMLPLQSTFTIILWE